MIVSKIIANLLNIQGIALMNKALLSPVFYALLVSQAHAEALPETNTKPSTTNAAPAAPAATPAVSQTAPVPPAPETQTAPSAPPTIDCNYHITTKQASGIDTALITTWAEKATLQSFSFTPTAIQMQLDALKACFTDQGWRGFNDALQKSGNLESIKTQQLNVSSQASGTPTINTVKDGQWKVTLPIEVIYQNDKEKVTQKLTVDVLIGRKSNGDLGIMQLIAATNNPTPTEPAAAAAPAQPKQ